MESPITSVCESCTESCIESCHDSESCIESCAGIDNNLSCRDNENSCSDNEINSNCNTTDSDLPNKTFHTNKLYNLHKRVPKRSTVVLAEPFFTGQRTRTNSSKRRCDKPLWRVLFDSGSDGDLLFVKKGSKKEKIPFFPRKFAQNWTTSNGSFTTDRQADLEVVLPEYSHSKRIKVLPDIINLNSSDPEPLYDMIIGTETMERINAVLDFETKMIKIDGVNLPMRDIRNVQTKNAQLRILANSYYMEPASTDGATKRAVKILDAKYEPADLPKVVNDNCPHLNRADKQKLLKLLQDFEQLFDGTLGDWRTEPAHLELKENISPFHGRAYQVPRIHRDTLRKEVDRLVQLGVLKLENDSQWASPTFIIPKKQGTVRFLSDFREVNKRIKRKPWPLPKISTVLQELEGFRWATSLDLNMGYYHIRLDPDSQKICTIVLPWGKYSYQRLPMGIAGSPDIFQEKMSGLMRELEYVRVYIDDLLTISTGSLDDHLSKLRQVLVRLSMADLKVNANKSFFCATSCEYLGYVLSREGIRPQHKKVEAILALSPPKTVREVRRFLGLVQYYRDLWRQKSDVLAPLTDLVGECGETKVTKKKGTKKSPFHWDESHQKAFDSIKQIMAKDVCLAYPNFNEKFEIYTDASTRQLGSVIVQNNRPIAFFSRKLTKAQQKYSVTELELLSIVETLKEFKGILWGQKVRVYTDHLNLTRDALGLTSDRVYRWRLLLEEYGPEIVYIKGIHNTVADALSRLEYDPMVNPDTKQKMSNFAIRKVQKKLRTTCVNKDNIQWQAFLNCFVNLQCEEVELQENETANDCINNAFANTSEDEDIYPLTITEIADAQRADKNLKKFFKQKKNDKSRYSVSIIEETRVLTDEKMRMVIPASLQQRAVKWYHHYLQHPGMHRLEETLRASMTWSGLKTHVKQHVKSCKSCQKNKRQSKSYGKLPEKLVIEKPWEALCVDLIGPYTLKGQDGTVMDFMCLTMIDPASGWFEMVELPVIEIFKESGKDVEGSETFDKTSQQIARLVNLTWFCRYPRPRKVIFDNGSEFKLHFQALCDTYGLKCKPTTVKNPQSNAILERTHQVIGNMMRTAEIDMQETVTQDDITDFVANASWAIRSTHHTVLKSSPGAAIFARDMLFDIPYIADWTKIGEYRQKQTKFNTARENKRRYDFDYEVGGKILIKKDGILRKAESKYTGPYVITQVYTNGTIRVQRGSTSERLNIRRVRPYFSDGSESDETE